uniref:Transmembrane protein n=1 Tax=Angiostrongylus cantonensis TaxID=6313 RepID=A0A158PCP0_ANGCA
MFGSGPALSAYKKAELLELQLIQFIASAVHLTVTEVAEQERMQPLLIFFCTFGIVVILSSAEPRIRISSGEDGFIRRAKELMRRRGKRSSPTLIEDDEEVPEDQDHSIEDYMTQLHRDRRGRVRELFG